MASDQLTLDLSQQPEYPSPALKNSDWLYVFDQNSSGNYSSGQAIIETSSLANSNKWLNWSTSAYLAIPATLRMTAGAVNKAVPTFAAGIKNGHFHLINSCMVEVNGVSIQQSASLSNLMWNYRLLTSMSYNDLIKNGASLGFWPDSSSSWTFPDPTADSLNGNGPCNNRDATSLTVAAADAGASGVGNNVGFLRRQTWLSFNADSGGNHSSVVSNTDLAQFFKSYVEYTPSLSGATQQYGQCLWRYIAIVRLRDICPLFAQIGLVKGLLVRLTLTLNQPTFTFTSTATNMPAPAVSFPYSGQTNPMMIASAEALNGSVTVASSATSYTCDVRIGKTNFSSSLSAGATLGTTTNTGPFGQGNIRLWVQSYVLSPAEEAELMSNPVRRYHYNDIYETDFTVEAGGNVSQLLFNSVPRTRKLVMIPMDATQGLTSPYDSAAGTTMPMCGITNFQVQLSGMQLFQNPLIPDYRFFIEQVSKTGLNDGLIEGLSSGLIGLDEWQNNYRFYTVDLHQGNAADDDTTKNIQVSFVCRSARTVRWYCFVEFERQLELNILSSAIISFR